MIKKIFILNIFLSLLAISHLIIQYDFGKELILVHGLIITFIYTLLVSFALLIFVNAKYLNRIVLRLIVSVVFSIYSLSLFGIYAISKVGMENWGNFVSLKMLLIYKNEIANLIEALPIHSNIIYPLIFLMLVIPFVGFFVISNDLLINLETLSNVIQKKFRTSKLKLLIVLSVYLMTCLIFLWSNRLHSQFFHQLQKLGDPIANTLIHVRSGSNNIFGSGQKAHSYPSDLGFERRNVIVITADCLRSDHLGVYGYDRETTPFLSMLSKESKLEKVDNFYSNCSLSYCGISSILSSEVKISGSNFFIQDLLKKQGYQIKFILSGDNTNFFSLKRYLSKSADTYYDGVDAISENPRYGINNDYEVVIDQLSKIGSFDNTPTFIYIHLMSIHQIGQLIDNFRKFKPDYIDLNNNAQKALINNYDNRILQFDDVIEKVFYILSEKKYLENAVVAISGDHGQALLENGNYWHGKSLYYNEINVPFMIYGNTKNDPLQNFGTQIDIAPTIIDILGLPKPKNWEGESLLVKNEDQYSFQNEREYYAVIYKKKDRILQYIYNSKSQTQELYDMILDKHQQNNLIDTVDLDMVDSLKRSVVKYFNL